MEESQPQRNSENSLPNTIVIQLVSQQPQAMPIAVNAMPLLPAPKGPVEQQQQRPSSLTRNSISWRASYPPQMPTKNKSGGGSPTRRSNPPLPFRNSARGSSQGNSNNTNLPPGQDRSVSYQMEYVAQPEDGRAPSYNLTYLPAGSYYSSVGGAEQMGTDCCCCCWRCRHGQRWIPQPEPFAEKQPRNFNSPPSRRSSTKPEDRRDQARNYDSPPSRRSSTKSEVRRDQATNGQRWIPEPELLAEEQLAPQPQNYDSPPSHRSSTNDQARNYDSPPSSRSSTKPEDRRDQAPNGQRWSPEPELFEKEQPRNDDSPPSHRSSTKSEDRRDQAPNGQRWIPEPEPFAEEQPRNYDSPPSHRSSSKPEDLHDQAPNGQRWIPEPEPFAEEQSRNNDSPPSRRSYTKPEDRRDQATNTSDELQEMQSLKTICETLGRALVAAATAAVEAAAAQKSESAVDRPTVEPSILAHALAQMQSGASEHYIPIRPKSKPKTSFADSKLSSVNSGKRDTPDFHSDGRLSVKYPKTPRGTLSISSYPVDTPRQSSGGVNKKKSKIIGQGQRSRSKSAAGRTPVRKFPMARQGWSPALIKGFSGPSIRRRLPTEKLPPNKEKENPGPTSPDATLLIVEQSEVPGLSIVTSSTNLAIVTSRPDPSK